MSCFSSLQSGETSECKTLDSSVISGAISPLNLSSVPWTCQLATHSANRGVLSTPMRRRNQSAIALLFLPNPNYDQKDLQRLDRFDALPFSQGFGAERLSLIVRSRLLIDDSHCSPTRDSLRSPNSVPLHRWRD